MIVRVPPDVAKEQVQQAIAVVVKEDCRRRVPRVVESGLFRNVPESTRAEVVEEVVAVPDGGYEKILPAIIVNVGERSGDADLTA